MPDEPQTPRKNLTPDWYVHGILTKLGEAFDRLLGRGWKPASRLATSELIERLKAILDAEARENGNKRRYVPHNIKLKMQWDKFATDSDEALQTLEAEMLTAVIDHINDKRYYTYAPVSLEAKPDYFIDGVKLFVSFDKADEERETNISVTLSGTSDMVNAVASAVAESSSSSSSSSELVVFRFTADGKPVEKEVMFEVGRRVGVGRTKESDLSIVDPSVSKIHASLLLNPEHKLVVADTGSTNGTFVGGQRIPYGKAVEIVPGAKLKFGLVDVELEFRPKPQPNEVPTEVPDTESYKVGEFEFTQRIEKPET